MLFAFLFLYGTKIIENVIMHNLILCFERKELLIRILYYYDPRVKQFLEPELNIIIRPIYQFIHISICLYRRYCT